MINFIKDTITAKTKEAAARARLAENNSLQQEIIGHMLTEANGLVTERPDTDGFYRIIQTDKEKGHLQPNQLEMIRKSREFYRWDSNGRAALDTLLHYIMGKGLTITPKSSDPMVWYIWREFWTAERNRMQLRQFEIITRTFRDGETLIQFFDKDDEGKATGKTTIRFIDPLLVKNPGGEGQRLPANFNKVTTRSGIEFDKEDIERPIRYWVQSRYDVNEFLEIKAEDLVHIKIFADSDQLRGETIQQPVMRLYTQYKQWLDNRIILNKMRTAIVLIKKVEGTPSQVAAISNTLDAARNQRYGEDKKENIRGGTVVTAGPGVDYKMESPNINAADVKDDGRNIKLGIAAGTNMPEYVFGDASNANYASSLIAESPFVKAVEYWQIFMEYWFGQIFKRVIQNAVDANMVTAPDDKEFLRKLQGIAQLNEAAEEGEEESPKEKAMKELMPNGKVETPSEIFFSADMSWPEIIHRDMKAHTEALQLARGAGWVSDPTASASLGWDFTEESRKQKQVEDDAKKTGNALLGIKPEDIDSPEDIDTMDGEIEDLMKTLTPEERQMILDKNDPREIADLLMKKKAAPPPAPKPGEED